MAFQRSYSKVWWGSDNQLPNSTYGSSMGSSLTSGGFYYSSIHNSAGPQQPQCQSFGGSGYHSLDYNSLRMYSGNLSRIQEVDDDEQQNSSKISWGKRESPGSLRSQDSGFSDNDESHSTRSLGGRSSKMSSPSTKSNTSRKSCDSPASTHTIATPPTVIRRVGRSEFYSPLVSVSRRISFSGSPTTTAASTAATTTASDEKENVEMKVSNIEIEDFEGSTLLAQLDSIQLLNSTPKQSSSNANTNDNDNVKGNNNNNNNDNDNINDVLADDHNNDVSLEPSTDKIKTKSKIKRRRRIVRTPTKPLKTPTKRRTLQKETNDDAASKCLNDDTDNDTNDNNDDDASSFDELEQELSELQRNVPEYNNETVYIGAIGGIGSIQAYNNETVILGEQPEDKNNNTLKTEDVAFDMFQSQQEKPNNQQQQQQSQQRTSTPKIERENSKNSKRMSTTKAPSMDFLIFEPITTHYANPLLNGHTPALQHWLYGLQSSCEQEVMSTLQTKSIAQEAFKNLTITTNTVAKLIRQLQQRALYMQSDFERMERLLNGNSGAYDALNSAEQLLANIIEFTNVLERRSVFFSESRTERKKYDDNLDQIKLITKDTRYSLERQHYINLDSLLDDIQVLKRYLLIALRQVFERMVRIIVHSIEQSRCDLMLRANINMVSTLTNIDYEGFASLTDAFVQNETVRALLIVCLEHNLSSIRAMALRALATICCAPAAISQLCSSDGIEILRDILQYPVQNSIKKRSSSERREAVSLLTQITAAWHGPEHRVDGLKDCVESIVAGLTQLVGESTSCTQTLLLCAAALNNLSRMEVTSHYSIMSNETVFKLIITIEERQQQQNEGISIFHYEQIVSMLYNMSLNKKCHSHLANGCVINFITYVYEIEFYKIYDSRAESDAQRRIIKAILHTLTRLIQDSNGGSLGLELLQHQRVPAMLFKLTNSNTSHGSEEKDHTLRATYEGCHQLGRDIEMLVKQLEIAQKQAQEQRCQFDNDYCNSVNVVKENDDTAGNKRNDEDINHMSRRNTNGSKSLKLNLTKQESFV